MQVFSQYSKLTSPRSKAKKSRATQRMHDQTYERLMTAQRKYEQKAKLVQQAEL